MAMGPGRSGELNSEINVTPLVDVMLVLLIIFMVTAPMLSSGVELDLPQAEAQPVEATPDQIVLSIDKNGAVFLQSVPITWEQVVEKVGSREDVKAGKPVYVEADTNLPYGTVLRAMALLQQAKVGKILMMTDPLDDTGRPEEP